MKKKRLLIPEEMYNSDFAPFASFYSYHVKGKILSVALDEIQGNGVALYAEKKRKKVENVDTKTLPVNTIIFASSKKNCNVKNMIWDIIRCTVAHPENIQQVDKDGTKCYELTCTIQDKYTKKIVPTMKGIIACDLWPVFANRVMEIIKKKEV